MNTRYSTYGSIVAVALALGAGTMVGWRRVVLTVGEKIGKQGMTYAQGMSAQVTAVAAIGLANVFSLPVSTTHVLSSGVAGTMIDQVSRGAFGVRKQRDNRAAALVVVSHQVVNVPFGQTHETLRRDKG